MATPEQFQQMLELMTTQQQQTQQQLAAQQQQMREQLTAMKALQEENDRLRTAEGSDGNNDNGRRYGTKKPDRPVINAGIDDREWVLFLDTWQRYKTMVKISATDIASTRLELRTACSSDVNKLLFEFVGADTLNNCTEEELLEHIKSVAVKVTDKEVHRVAFGKMCQNEGETITHFVARLKAKSFLCKFEVQCDQCDPVHNVSYSDQRVAERVIAGLRNQEHQRKILSEAATLKTLEQKVNRLQIFETTEESASLLHRSPHQSNIPALANELAALRKNKSNDRRNRESPKCRFCGYMTHGISKTMSRSDCPALDKKCNNCNKKGHFTSVCEKAKTASAEVEDEAAESLENIAADASVSFGFAASAVDLSQTEFQAPDFRLARRSTKNT